MKSRIGLCISACTARWVSVRGRIRSAKRYWKLIGEESLVLCYRRLGDHSGLKQLVPGEFCCDTLVLGCKFAPKWAYCCLWSWKTWTGFLRLQLGSPTSSWLLTTHWWAVAAHDQSTFKSTRTKEQLLYVPSTCDCHVRQQMWEQTNNVLSTDWGFHWKTVFIYLFTLLDFLISY